MMRPWLPRWHRATRRQSSRSSFHRPSARKRSPAACRIDRVKIYRARVFTPLGDPFTDADASHQSWDDGYVAVDDAGKISAVGDAKDAPVGEVIDFGRNAL